MADANLSSFIWSVAEGEEQKLYPIEQAGSGSVQEKTKAHLREIIGKVNELFQGELTDHDKLVYVNNVLKGKLLESDILVQQAGSNTKEQFANSPDLNNELLNAIMVALDAHNLMSTQALNSEKVRKGLKDILLNNAGLYEALREKAVA
jgi:type I restriction enzyme R subunit